MIPLKSRIKRRLPIGAEVMYEGTHFRVWAPSCQRVEIVIEDPITKQAKKFPLEPEEGGYFSQLIDGIKEGTNYWFQLDQSSSFYPDPATRFQPQGPYGPSCVVDPMNYPWTDQNWNGIEIDNQIIYEMHVGTFTQEGTLSAAQLELPELVRLGITVIELMPLNEFPGNFNWGYDGVNLFAPSHLYGKPHELQEFINRAHELDIGVLLDVVYNHFGPEANFISQFSDQYFREETEWGQGINFDQSEVRLFFLSNVHYWIDEYHFDGLRVDATHAMRSSGSTHILQDMAAEVKRAGKKKKTLVVGENDTQESIIFRPLEEGGYGFDALWNDDFHHAAIVRLTGRREAYYRDYIGSPQELLSCLKHGFLFQGQHHHWQKKLRGTPCLDIKASSFILFIQNHDQIAHSGRGRRLHQLTDPGNLRAMTCLLLLAPGTPMLFQGQEFAASAPFLYFADHNEDLSKKIAKGRGEFLKQFPRLASEEMQEKLSDPSNFQTFLDSKINLKERESHHEIYLFHQDLIRLRRQDSTFSTNRDQKVDGSILNQDAFIFRYFSKNGMDRLLIFNFGNDFALDPCSDPLLAPPEDAEWTLLLSSEARKYGGEGTPLVKLNQLCFVPGHSALVFRT
jgi:maltooligosyltrehalose trehalohydrolase